MIKLIQIIKALKNHYKTKSLVEPLELLKIISSNAFKKISDIYTVRIDCS